jgi:tRNA A-37 threonylcarbamoyl transferase component Bud32
MDPRSTRLPLQLPARLQLPGGEGQIECLRAARIIAGRRYVYEGSWDGQRVYVKLFAGRGRAQRQWSRERQGLVALAALGVPAPRLRYAGSLPAYRAYALVTEAVPAARTLEEACNRAASPEEEALGVLNQAVAVLARQHAGGILQRDVHLNNFLVAVERVYSIDASGMRVRRRALGRRRSLHNLGGFLGQFFPRFDRYTPVLLRHYAKARGWEAGPRELSRLYAHIDRTRKVRKRRFLRKIFTSGSNFTRRRGNGHVIVCNRAYEHEPWRALLSEPEHAFDAPGSAYLKRGNTATVVRASIAGSDIVIKRYNLKSTWHALQRALRRTRASISWENAHLLRFYGIPTPQPIAVVERRIGPLRRTSYFISEYVEGVDSRTFFGGDRATPPAKEAMAERIVAVLATLARYRVGHGDMKATNIVICGETPYWVDLDAMREYKTALLFRSALKRDMMRLRLNWKDRPKVGQIFEQALARARAEGALPDFGLMR